MFIALAPGVIVDPIRIYFFLFLLFATVFVTIKKKISNDNTTTQINREKLKTLP